MESPNNYESVSDSPEATRLYLAAQANDEAVVKAILASPAARRDQLNVIETTKGWTPLFVACAKGFAPTVRLLIGAEADQGLVDFAGWTAKEHAVFRGHLKVGKLLATPELREHGGPATRLQPRARRPVDYRRQSRSSQIFVYLGPSHTRSHLEPVELDVHSLGSVTDVSDKTSFSVTIKAQNTSDNSSYTIQLPILENMVNKPVSFSTDDPEKVTLIFELHRSTCTSDTSVEVIGTGIALLQSLRQGLAPNRESLIRHYTVPMLHNGLMTRIGAVTFSVLVITPFQFEGPLPKISPGFWKGGESYPVVGHRGSGANSTVRTNLQVGENTFQSFLTAINRGACGVEFDVQLTKDYYPVIYHDFLVKETGGDVPVHGLTLDQFEHCSRSQAPRSDLSSSGEQRYLERNYPDEKRRPKPRSYSDNKYDDYRSQDLMQRIKYTEEGLLGNFRGNLRGCSIQEPSTILEQLLTELPESIAFDLEIKYPMLWEAEDRNMEFFAIELNFYVDTILAMVFRHCGDRNITLSSFSPEVCIALACKQQSFPILLISKAGSVPVSDVRAGSLQGAIEFATAWDLAGIVLLSDPFVMCPRLLTYTKDSGLVVSSYGHLNNDPECALVNSSPRFQETMLMRVHNMQIQVKAHLDAIITDKAHLISQTLAKANR
ncbi:Glycerophosphocholine phosphodiesterase [Pseudocyphellaria aurata]|nr:Glycerophosphocholine phosphodiesterase [Pseudocyphellaria aurata]